MLILIGLGFRAYTCFYYSTIIPRYQVLRVMQEHVLEFLDNRASVTPASQNQDLTTIL